MLKQLVRFQIDQDSRQWDFRLINGRWTRRNRASISSRNFPHFRTDVHSPTDYVEGQTVYVESYGEAMASRAGAHSFRSLVRLQRPTRGPQCGGVEDHRSCVCKIRGSVGVDG